MKLFFCLFFLLQFLPNSLGYYSEFIWQDSSLVNVAGSDTAWSNIVCSYDGKMVYAEIENGNSYHSTDYGATWTLTTGPSCFGGNCALIAASGDGSYVYKASNNSFFRSSDSGASFGSLEHNFTFPLALVTDETGQYVLVSDLLQSRLLLSRDYGNTFSTTSAPELDYRAAAAGHDLMNIIVVSSGKGSNNHVRIHFSSDMGTTFTQSFRDFTGSSGVLSVACDWDCKYGVVSGPYNGQSVGVWYTSDYGLNWLAASASTPGTLASAYSLVMDTSGQYALAGLAASDAAGLAIYFSKDFGYSWTKSTNKNGAYVSLAAPKSFKNAFAVSGVKGASASSPYNVLKGTAIHAPTAAPSTFPSSSPSAKPTVTAAPTSATRTQVTLNCNATISGIDATSFDQDYINGFESAISESVLEGKAANSHVISIEDQENTRRLLLSFVRKAIKVTPSASSSIILTFNVSAIMEETGLTSSTAFDVMYENLKAAVSSGVIQDETNSYVENLKGGSYTPITVLSIASSKSEVTYDVIQKPKNDSSDYDISTTNIIIIVVVILGTFLIILLAALFYYFYWVQLGYSLAPKGIPAENARGTEKQVVVQDGSTNI